MLSSTTTAYVRVCRMTEDDLAAVLQIERSTYSTPWKARDFRLALHSPLGCECLVARAGNAVVGYMVCETTREAFRIINLAVCPDVRRQGVGDRMVTWLLGLLDPNKRHSAGAMVRESNLAFQLFLRAVGFTAERVVRDYYGDEDGYLFSFRVIPEAEDV